MSPCVQEIYSVDQRQLEELTAHMTYVAPEVSEYFTEVLMEHEVYYITLGHSFDEIPTVEQSSDLICISSEGISCIEISRVGGDYRKEARIEHILPIEDALTIFLEDQKEILQERIIDKISFAYFSEAQIDNYIYYSPQWIIHSYYTPATLYKADKKIALGETCLINADTGKLGYLDATEMLQIE